MNKYIAIYLVILMSIISCRNGNKTDFVPAQPSVVPELTDPSEIWVRNTHISSEDFVKSEMAEIKYIFLQSDQSSPMVGAIDQIFVDDSTITVIDNSITGKIAVFDNHGSLLRLIGSKGKARGEYIGLGCVSKTADGNLAVSDRLSGKLILYSPDGELLDEFRMNNMMPQSMMVADSIILGSFPGYLRSSEFRLKWIDNMGKEINTALPYTSARQYVAGEILNDGKGNIYYNYPLNDTVYRISGFKIIPEIVMHIHDSALTNEFIKSTENLDEADYMNELINNENIVNLVSLIKCDEKWIAHYQQGKNAFLSVISDNGKSRVNYRKSEVSHIEKTGRLFLPEKFVGFSNGNLIGYIDTEAFRYMGKSDVAKYLKMLKENSVNIPDNDDEILNYGNMILCIYKMKL